MSGTQSWTLLGSLVAMMAIVSTLMIALVAGLRGTLNARFAAVDQRFAATDQRFADFTAVMDRRFADFAAVIGQRLDGLDQRVGRLEEPPPRQRRSTA